MTSSKYLTRAAALLPALLLALPPAAGAAEEPVAQITAAVGNTRSGDQLLEGRPRLGEGSAVETEEDGGCSLILDEDALMEMCASTSVSLTRKGGQDDGPRVVKLDRGDIRMVVEPRLGEERIEVHTPAAIATILGTILHVSVDALGVTTVTSTASRVMVQSADSSVKGNVTLEAGEQIVIEPGQAPQQPTKLDAEGMAALGGCLIDFHNATLSSDRGAQADRSIQQAIQSAIADAAGPNVAAATGTTPGPGPVDPGSGPPEDPASPENVFTPAETGSVSSLSSGSPGDGGIGDPIGGGIGGGGIPGGGGQMGGGVGGGGAPGGGGQIGGGVGGGEIP